MNSIVNQFIEVEGFESVLEKDLTNPYQWRDSKGNFHYPDDMETRHLFFTLRMIWNYTCPSHMQLHPFKKYNHFDDFYTPKYFMKSIEKLLSELSKREDLTPYFQKQIGKMLYHLGELKKYNQKELNNIG